MNVQYIIFSTNTAYLKNSQTPKKRFHFFLKKKLTNFFLTLHRVVLLVKELPVLSERMEGGKGETEQK